MNTPRLSTIPYGLIADSVQAKGVVLFLGAAASFVGASTEVALPSGKSLAASLAKKAAYPGPETDPLSKVTQYIEEDAGDRSILLTHIMSTFDKSVPAAYTTSVTQFLNQLDVTNLPKLIITTNYDLLVEKVLTQRSIRFHAISHVMRGSKYAGRLLRYTSINEPLTKSNIVTHKEVEFQLAELEEEVNLPLLVYKMHGTALMQGPDIGLIDSVVLTENDYIDFLARETLSKIPSHIINIIRDSRLLFLGYSLDDWNFRVLLRRISLLCGASDEGHKRHWGCLMSPDPVEERFWAKRGVNIYNESLDVFLDGLSRQLTGRSI